MSQLVIASGLNVSAMSSPAAAASVIRLISAVTWSLR